MSTLSHSWPLWSVFLFLALPLTFASEVLRAGSYGKGYHLVEAYEPHNFFDKFDFFKYPDPTGGFVQYVSRKEANETGLIRVHRNHTHPEHSHVYMGVDHKNVYDLFDTGRKSVRIQTRKAYTRGLFILNMNHMPQGCGTWPAWWTVGPRWPYTGEIDIIEGVNQNDYNLMSLHTAEGCTIAGAEQKGILVTNDCNSLRQDVGCGVLRNTTSSFGKGFNQKGGGVYAMEWTASAIKIWHWRHIHVPKSITEGSPDPSEFGKPVANLAGSCNVNQHFRDHSVVFDMDFCGNYAGYAYGQSQCPLANLGHVGCNEFVAKNPDAFKEAYWMIRSMHVFQKRGSDVEKYHPPKYESVVPVVSKNPQSASSLLPRPMGHKTTFSTKTSHHHTSTLHAKTSKPTSHRPTIKTTVSVKPLHRPSHSSIDFTTTRSVLTPATHSHQHTRHPTSIETSSPHIKHTTSSEHSFSHSKDTSSFLTTTTRREPSPSSRLQSSLSSKQVSSVLPHNGPASFESLSRKVSTSESSVSESSTTESSTSSFYVSSLTALPSVATDDGINLAHHRMSESRKHHHDAPNRKHHKGKKDAKSHREGHKDRN